MIIYKYVDEKGALKTIENNSVILKTPSEYNDPFDCVISVGDKERKNAFKLFLNYQLFTALYETLVTNKNKVVHLKELAKIHRKLLEQTASKIKEKEAYTIQPFLFPYHSLAYRFIGKSKKELLNEFDLMLKKAFSEMRKAVLVSCFGSSYDSILMWSHYANKHKGACIEFEADDEDFKQIAYSKEMPSFKLCKILEPIFGHLFLHKDMDDSDKRYEFVDEPLLTKSIDWKYEGEIRCVYSAKKRDKKIYETLDDKGNIVILLKMPKIKKVYIGCNATADFIFDIKGLEKEIPIVKMKMKDDEYGVEPE